MTVKKFPALRSLSRELALISDALPSLRSKRVALVGEIKAQRAELRAMQGTLRALDDLIRLYAPGDGGAAHAYAKKGQGT